MTSVRWQYHNHHPSPQNTCLTNTHPWEYLCGSQRVQQRSSSIPVVGAKTPKIDALKRVSWILSLCPFRPFPKVSQLSAKRDPTSAWDFFDQERRMIVSTQLLKPCRTRPIDHFFLASPRIQRVSHRWVVRRNWEQVREVRTHRHKGLELNEGQWILQTTSQAPSGGPPTSCYGHLNWRLCPKLAQEASHAPIFCVPHPFRIALPAPGACSSVWVGRPLLKPSEPCRQQFNSAGLEDDTQFWAFQALP